MLYACDYAWWKVHFNDVSSSFDGELWTQDTKARREFGIQFVPGVSQPGLGRDGTIHHGGNSGYQAINLAWLWGAKTIILLGFDCKQAADGKAHWFGQHGPGLIQRQPFSIWQNAFPVLAKDIEGTGCQVVNCSRDTALQCFVQMSLENAIGTF